jgi:hypothetical protein
MLAACLAASAAHAETKTLAKSGGWEAFGGTATGGRPVCGISTNPGERYFGLKFFSGDATFTIQVGDNAWKITNENKYNLTMRFDREPVWTAAGSGMHFDDGDPGIQYSINRSELAKFTREFGSSKQLVLRALNMGTAEWKIDLTGVRAVKVEFDNCRSNLK